MNDQLADGELRGPMVHSIDGEIAYPIYAFNARWLQDPTEFCPADTPDGKIWNHCDFYRMFKEDKTPSELNEISLKWWEEYKLSKHFIVDFKGVVEPPEISVEFSKYEVWCIGWFSHWTFDVGKSDQHVLFSFQKFVDRMRNVEKYCLMGAEDRWRWSGSDDCDTGPFGQGNKTDPPCRCKQCKKLGIVRIDH